MFNFRNFSKSTKARRNKKFTLESKHKEMMKNFDEVKKSLPQLKKRFVEIANEYKEYKSKSSMEMTSADFDSKFKLKKELKELRSKINAIEKNDDVVQYYLKVGMFLHDCHENKHSGKKTISEFNLNKGKDDEVSVPEEPAKKEEKVKEQKKEKKYTSVVDFFNNREKLKPQAPPPPPKKKKEVNKNDDSDNYKITKMSSFVETKDGFQRANCLDYYLKNIDKTYNPKVIINKDFDKCQDCGVEMTIYQSEGFQVCPKCGRQDHIITESDKPSFKDPPPEVSYFAYKRMNHFNECIAQFQGKESTEVPQEVFDKLILEIKKERITNLATLTPLKIRKYLKKLKLNKFYEHVPHILYRINGVPPPVLSKQLEEKLRLMFKDIQSPFREVKPKKRKNFLSYSYVLYKFLELLGFDEYKEYFPLLKDREKLYETDTIWSKLTAKLGWQFIRSV